jgi:hypothetical protein
MKHARARICYLCGKALLGVSAVEDKDHVPPKQLLAKSLRKSGSRIRLRTLEVHRACNNSYSADERYFTHLLLPFAKGSPAGEAARRKASSDYKEGKARDLVHRVLGQAKSAVNGVILPSGHLWLDYDRTAVDRVVGKIIRGLVYLEHQTILSLPSNINARITLPGQKPPEDFVWFMRSVPHESKGEHQGVFAYRYTSVEGLHYWAMLIWDRVIITACFSETTSPHGEAT